MRWRARRTVARTTRRATLPWSNQRGSAMIMVAVSLLALLSFAILAIDGPILMTTRGQLQAAADAAALAGASGLLEGSRDLAVARAIEFAGRNRAVQDSLRPVLITADDVTFPAADIIRVRTHRTTATGDPLRTYFMRVVDLALPNVADVEATASARVFDVCASQCLKPWAIPDRWEDADGNGAWTAGELYDPDLTGYRLPNDLGALITLKVGNPHQAISPGIFYPVDYPPLDGPRAPLTGGEWYRSWIADCEPFYVTAGDRLQLEPGNMVGPTNQGIGELVDRDPGAVWNPTTNTVEDSAYATSPRVVLVPLFDPTLPPDSGRNWVRVSRIAAFFIESTGNGGEVMGRFLGVTSPGLACAPGLNNGFVKSLALVE